MVLGVNEKPDRNVGIPSGIGTVAQATAPQEKKLSPELTNLENQIKSYLGKMKNADFPPGKPKTVEGVLSLLLGRDIKKEEVSDALDELNTKISLTSDYGGLTLTFDQYVEKTKGEMFVRDNKAKIIETIKRIDPDRYAQLVGLSFSDELIIENYLGTSLRFYNTSITTDMVLDSDEFMKACDGNADNIEAVILGARRSTDEIMEYLGKYGVEFQKQDYNNAADFLISAYRADKYGHFGKFLDKTTLNLSESGTKEVKKLFEKLKKLDEQKSKMSVDEYNKERNQIINRIGKQLVPALEKTQYICATFITNVNIKEEITNNVKKESQDLLYMNEKFNLKLNDKTLDVLKNIAGIKSEMTKSSTSSYAEYQGYERFIDLISNLKDEIIDIIRKNNNDEEIEDEKMADELWWEKKLEEKQFEKKLENIQKLVSQLVKSLNFATPQEARSMLSLIEAEMSKLTMLVIKSDNLSQAAKDKIYDALNKMQEAVNEIEKIVDEKEKEEKRLEKVK